MDFLNMRVTSSIEELKEIKKGFEAALIWQEEDLDQYSDKILTFELKMKIDQVCRTFYHFALTNESLHDEMTDYGFEVVGHSLCLQLLGHGAGFFDQDSTKGLDQLCDYLLDKSVVKPFGIYYNANEDKLDWDLA